MVMVTRSAHRKTLQSFDSTDSEHVSRQKHKIIPPWCSSGKHRDRSKSRKALPWEIRSSYPLRENIWEFLREGSSNYKRVRKQCKQTPGGNKSRAASALLLFLACGLATALWMCNSLPETNLIKAIAGNRFVSLLSAEPTSVAEECCYRMKHLAAALFRAEEALRSALRTRKTLMLTAQSTKMAPTSTRRIEGATASAGDGTVPWGGAAALWGVVPLRRAAPKPDKTLSETRVVPADCWPFSGSEGELEIQLPRSQPVRALSVEHVKPDTARSAPKQFLVYGVLQNGTWVKTLQSQYRANGPAKQFYPMQYRSVPLQRVIFRVLSNQGNADYTCLYRVHLYESLT